MTTKKSKQCLTCSNVDIAGANRSDRVSSEAHVNLGMNVLTVVSSVKRRENQVAVRQNLTRKQKNALN